MVALNRFKLRTALVVIPFLLGCGGSENSQTESFGDLAETDEEEVQQPVPLMVITYSVESFQNWNEAFVADKRNRELFELTDLGFLASAEDPRRVSVILRASEHAKSAEYASSESLRESLGQMGVIGEPEIRYMDALKLPDRPVTQRYRMMISHEVEDYDRWKEIFDQHEAERIDAGLELIGIAHEIDNNNMVSVLFAFEDMDAAKIFASSDELKTAMEESGVISEPVLTWLEKPSLD